MNWLLGVVGTTVGMVVGYFLFAWLLGYGLYAMLLPGALAGLGCGVLSRTYSIGLGIFAGCCALALGIFLEWKFLPFVDDGSFGYFLRHLHHLTPVTILMIVGGAALGFWFGRGRAEYAIRKPAE